MQATELPKWLAQLRATDTSGNPMPDSERPMMIALEQGKAAHKRFRTTGFDQRERSIEGCAFPLFGEGGETIAVVGIFWQLESIA